MFLYAICLLQLHFVISGAWPHEKLSTSIPQGINLTMNEAVDEKGVCKVNGSFPLDCNTCICVVGSHPACTLMGCMSMVSPNFGGECKPGDKWKIDDCNYCVCNSTGHPSCSSSNCSTQSKIRPKRANGKPQEGGKCKPREEWYIDECNKCVCTHTGYPSCSLNDCSKEKGRGKRSSDGTRKPQEGGKCKPREEWYIDECNKCVCTHTGYPSCSLNDCSKEKGRGKRSSDGTRYSDYVDSQGKCKGKATFKMDCNSCHCSQIGLHPLCTLMTCPETEGPRITRDTSRRGGELLDEFGACKVSGTFKVECNVCHCTKGQRKTCTNRKCSGSKRNQIHRARIIRDARNENGNSGLDCKPGISWKESCNSCFCSERGIAMCTDIPTCPSPPPAPGITYTESTTMPPTPSPVSSLTPLNITSTTEYAMVNI